MVQILQNKMTLKIDFFILKCMPNFHNILGLSESFIIKTNFELEFNPTSFVQNECQIKQMWLLEVSVI